MNSALACLFHKPSHAEATFVQSTGTQRLKKIILTMSCCYSLDSSRGVLSVEYPRARVSAFFHVFHFHFVLAKLITSSLTLMLLVANLVNSN